MFSVFRLQHFQNPGLSCPGLSTLSLTGQQWNKSGDDKL